MEDNEEEELDIYDDKVQEGMWWELVAADGVDAPLPPDSMCDDEGDGE